MDSISSRYGDLFRLIILNSIIKGGLFGSIAIVAYLTIVVITTPALSPQDAIKAVLVLNLLIIIGTSVGVGLQTYLSEYSKKLGCNLKINKATLSGNSGSATATSFFSFFSLIPLGCCGWWLYVISFLPSIFGAGVSSLLINHSQLLAYLGLVVIFSFNGLTIFKLIKEMKQRHIQYK
jgi:hypothetical protein